MLYYVDVSKITKLEISEKIKKEIDDFTNDYYDRYSGIYLKSKILFYLGVFIITLIRIYEIKY